MGPLGVYAKMALGPFFLTKNEISVIREFREFAGDIVSSRQENRQEHGKIKQHIFEHLEDALDPETGKGYDIVELLEESRALITAGKLCGSHVFR